MAGHTKGPWHVVNPDTTSDFVSDGVHMQICRLTRPVAMGPLGKTANGPYEQQRANAHLIAAAPELLAACEAALRVLPAARANGWHEGMESARKSLNAAIAKAQGAHP